jgi:hypothetical protein
MGLCPSPDTFDIEYWYVILFWGIFEMGFGVWIMRIDIGMRDYGEERWEKDSVLFLSGTNKII